MSLSFSQGQGLDHGSGLMADVGLIGNLGPALGFDGGIRPDLGSNRGSGPSLAIVPDVGQDTDLIICLIIGFIIGPDLHLLLAVMVTGESLCVWW